MWKAKRYKVCSGKRWFWHYCLQLSFVYKIVSQIFLNLFCSGVKKLLSKFLRKWRWFQGHERFPKYLGKKLKFHKTETRFCRWKSTDNNDINIFMSPENPCTFFAYERKDLKERFFNTNCREKQMMPSKRTVNWLFNDTDVIYSFLVLKNWRFFKKQL